MQREINETTGLPAIVAFRETLDGNLVVFTFDESHPYDDMDFHRKGYTSPVYFLSLCGRLLRILCREDLYTLLDHAEFCTTQELMDLSMLLRKYRTFVGRNGPNPQGYKRLADSLKDKAMSCYGIMLQGGVP